MFTIVDLFVSRIMQKLLDQFSQNLGHGNGPRKKVLDFEGNVEHVALGIWLHFGGGHLIPRDAGCALPSA